MQVEGWLIYVPETVSIAFLAANKHCISGELLEWQVLTIDQNMNSFISKFSPKVENLGPCRFYFIDHDWNELENWLATCEQGSPIAR